MDEDLRFWLIPKKKADKLFAELKEQGYKSGSEFFNRWLQFEAYRKIVFRDSIYTIKIVIV